MRESAEVRGQVPVGSAASARLNGRQAIQNKESLGTLEEDSGRRGKGRCGLRDRGERPGDAALLPLENVSVEAEAEGLQNLVGVIGQLDGTRRHVVAVAFTVYEPGRGHRI